MPQSVMVTIDGSLYQADTSHPHYNLLRQAVKDNDAETFVQSYNVKQAVENFVSNTNGLELVGEDIFYNGQQVHNAVVDNIRRMMAEGFDIDPMLRFLENLLQNPSYTAINQLWNFIEAMGLTVTEDGCFLAYKTVRKDYKDKYSGTVDNSPGASIARMPRNQVSDDDNVCAGPGYHAGSLGYAGPGGWYNNDDDRVVIVKINPADVVRVPKDHKYQKLVCCYYEPIADFKGEIKSSVCSGKVNDDYTVEPAEENFDYEYIDADDMIENDTYTCAYTDRFGNVKQRFFMVDYYDGSGNVCVELIDPEENAGEWRSFVLSRMEYVKPYDVADKNYW